MCTYIHIHVSKYSKRRVFKNLYFEKLMCKHSGTYIMNDTDACH